MEGIEWSRLIAPLLPGLHSPSVSKLPSADCQPPSTPLGHSFNPLENRLRQKNTEKFLPSPFFMGKILFVHFYCLRQEIIVEILRGNGWVIDM